MGVSTGHFKDYQQGGNDRISLFETHKKLCIGAHVFGHFERLKSSG
jgi:hypothetical protein